MITQRVIPILNVSNIQESFAWFEKLGWKKGWDWGDPVGFGGVHSGNAEIFLCENGQGGRGKGSNTTTFGAGGSENADKGSCISLMVGDIDEIYRHCVEEGLDITFPPTDMPWNLREMHVRHPDGHVFRIGQGLEEDE